MDDSLSESVIDPQPNDFSGASLSGDEGSETEVCPRNNQPTNEEIRHFRKPINVTKKKRRPDPVELELISALKEKPDRHT
ncbi:hypothetical protein J6590_084479 [Homalodisca vitripennis]|nr:hypothetical protein J6590_084479 [Homalodisca vitripennis]